MSDLWIESHQALREHPKTRKLARLLSVSVPTVIGYLHCLWWWALDYAADGDLSPYDADEIEHAACWDGDAGAFWLAICDVGFVDGGGGHIHDWHDYAGKLIERRERDRQRKAASRPQDVRGRSAGSPKDGVSTVPNLTVPKEHMSADADDAHVSPVDKSANAHAQVSKSAQADAHFDAFWDAYPRKLDKRRAQRAWTARIKASAIPAEMIRAAKTYADFCNRDHIDPTFIKHAATFIGPDCPYLDWLHGIPRGAGNARPRFPVPEPPKVELHPDVTCSECGRVLTPDEKEADNGYAVGVGWLCAKCAT